MATIYIKGQAVQVDDTDLPMVSAHKWNLQRASESLIYVRTCIHEPKNNRRARTVYLHRLICGLEKGDRAVVDHIDGNPLNNLRSNLRVTNPSGNVRNRRTKKGGVGKHCSGKWRARVRSNGKVVYHQLFDTEQEARVAYAEAALRIHGEFARVDELQKILVEGAKPTKAN